MREHRFTEGSFYHVYIHSVGDMALFRGADDYRRFILTMFLTNGEASIPRLDRSTDLIDLNSVWGIDIGPRLVKIINFCAMSTHIHLTIGELKDGNISRYMHKFLVSLAKYLNKKYERRGHVFESKFHSRHLDTNEYLLRVSSYIHLNPYKISNWEHKEDSYPWSSYQDYMVKNRWGDRLQPDIILSQFNGGADYRRFTEESRSEIIDSEFPTA
jgi:hypothetical protein